jgi:ribosomal protein S1
MTLGAIAAIGLVIPAFALPEPPPVQQQQERPEKAQPFHGKVDSVDNAARTLTVDGKLIYTSDSTKFTKDGKAIKLNQIMAGDEVHGTTRQTYDGKTEAVTVNVGPKPKEKEKEPPPQ